MTADLARWFGSGGTLSRMEALREMLKDKLGPVSLSALDEGIAALRDREQAIAQAVAAEREALLPWAAFGERVFEAYWNDGECCDVDAGEAQQHAVEFGLLGRTSTHDAGATHAEGCEWQPGDPDDDCDCFVPLKSSAAIRARGEKGGV